MCLRTVSSGLLLIALGSGCRILDRERYSLVVRKPAHRYREPTPAEAEQPKESFQDALPPPEIEETPSVASLEPFRPFVYCHLHRSTHGAESLAALLLAPAELPLALAVDTGADVTLALVRELGSWWNRLFEGDVPEVPDLPKGPQ